jgi:hypothetical protein
MLFSSTGLTASRGARAVVRNNTRFFYYSPAQERINMHSFFNGFTLTGAVTFSAFVLSIALMFCGFFIAWGISDIGNIGRAPEED